MMTDSPSPSPSRSASKGPGTYTLLDALKLRRSRRFGRGMSMDHGPLAFVSRQEPRPLTEEEEAWMVFAASGMTGAATADLCYAPGQGGNIMAGLAGRTMASGDGMQTVACVVINDATTYLIRRPQDFDREEIKELIALAKEERVLELYRRLRIQIKPGRCAPPLEPLFNIRANQWAAYAPGTTYFLPINDLSFMYINGLLEVLNESTGAFILDDRAMLQPAGLKSFAKSRGGHLEDDPKQGRVITVRHVETLVTEFITAEQGMMLQNLALMSQALGLGGYPNFANHEFGWFQALGFSMSVMPASRYLGTGTVVAMGMKAMGQDLPVPYPVGLEVDGQVVLKPFCPPCYSSMKAAVEAVVEAKYGSRGVFGDSDGISSWSEPARVIPEVPKISSTAIDATAAYCEYLWNRYGRFPVCFAPYRTVLGFQACHLDQEFYEKFYRPEALSETQRNDFEER